MLRYCILLLSIFSTLTLRGQVAGDLEQYELQYHNGYTLVSIFSYQIKIVAEQRSSDMLAQVVVVPQEQGAQFKIENVDFLIMPPSNDLGGPVAQVDGLFYVQVNQSYPVQILKMVPVEVATVDSFSISADEATIQGNSVVQKQLSEMLSDEMNQEY